MCIASMTCWETKSVRPGFWTRLDDMLFTMDGRWLLPS